ncbi:MAG: hypothetical protein KKF22_06350 [Gammaproteobacteria bacterium]|nr:hypothetical protein [Gammaproteobacteria bacterium]
MKQLANRKIMSVLAISLCLGVFAHHYKSSTTELCQAAMQADPSKPLAITSLCKPSQQSWFSWLQGNSRSTQFHFVDLLELLNRFDHRG